MTQYIDKSALVAEIEGLKSAAETMLTGKTDLPYWKAQKHLCERFLSFIDTLEVKELGSMQEKPKPKFHIGDTIRHRDENDSFKVLAIEDDCYRLENNIVVSIAAQDQWEVVEEPTPHYPKAKEASGTLKNMLDNITEESLEKARKQLEEEPAVSIWHDPKEMPPDDIIVFRYIDGLTTCRYVGQTMKGVLAWAYFNELKKL